MFILMIVKKTGTGTDPEILCKNRVWARIPCGDIPVE